MNKNEGKRILVIEDDKQVAKVLKINLERLGHDVLLAEDGAQGIKAFQEHAVDLIITDIIMPEKDGIETIRELKKISNVKILAMSGGGRIGPEGYLKAAAFLGGRLDASKPFKREELYQALDKLFDQP